MCENSTDRNQTLQQCSVPQKKPTHKFGLQSCMWRRHTSSARVFLSGYVSPVCSTTSGRKRMQISAPINVFCLTFTAPRQKIPTFSNPVERGSKICFFLHFGGRVFVRGLQPTQSVRLARIKYRLVE